MYLSQEEIISKLEECSKDYQAGKFDNHKQYLRKFNSIKNLNSVTNLVKRWGAKVTREEGYTGYYIYHGKNFTVGLNEASCETNWWEVGICSEGVAKEVYDNFYDFNTYDTKGEVVMALLQFDKQMNEDKK